MRYVCFVWSAYAPIYVMHEFQTVQGHREVQLFGPSAQIQLYVPEFHVCFPLPPL
jgi:hypothetical protein